jgi:tRNA(Arg) A34 adenosine deaminase TadA
MTDAESHMRRAIELAREAAGTGDGPYGSVLVRDGEIVAEARNTTVTDDDVSAHPELKLARLAGQELDSETRRETTMYTSTEPCPMCSGAIRLVGLDRVVYATGAVELAEMRETDPGVRSETVLDGVTTVEGGLLADAGRKLHEKHR